MLYRFGEFELSEKEFSLRRNGKRVPLEPRALGVLILLAGSPSKLLDKKSLLQGVWKDTFVEETTLTRAIAIGRKQLGDDAREPRYIETVPTKGYRFIAPVVCIPPMQDTQTDLSNMPANELSAPDPQPNSQSGTQTDLLPDSSVLPEKDTRTVFAGRDVTRHRAKVLAIAVSLSIAIAGFFYFMHRRQGPPPLNVRDTLVLADFQNTTGDAAFDIALRQGLLVELEQSPVLKIASDARIRTTLKRMGHRDDDSLSTPVAQEVCQRLGGSVVLQGSVTRLGGSYVIGLRARRCNSGEELDAEQVQVARKEDALHAISQIATQFRSRLGEAAATLNELQTPLAEATTPSLEALSAFSRGMQAFNTKGSGAAVPLFRYATELDPDFAWAHAWLGRMYADLGKEDLAVASTRRAHDLRNRASERERFTIDISYDLLVTGNLLRAREACDAWLQMYPHDVYPRAFLATTIYPAFGQYERALAEAKQMIEQDPDFVVGYRDAIVSLIALNRADEAETVLRTAAQRKVFLASFVTDAYRIAFLRGDMAGMQQALRGAPKNPWLVHYHAATLARAGRLQESQTLQDQAVRLAKQSAREDLEAELTVAAAYTDLFYGYPEKSARAARTALALHGGRYVKASAALILAMAGYTNEASSLGIELRTQFPEDTVLQQEFLPSIQAAIALDQKKPQFALDLLEATSPPDGTLPLYPAYLKGQALLALGRGPQAAAAFRTIVDRPGVVLNDPLWNVVQLSLAKAYTLSGDRADAQAAVKAVLRQWNAAEVSVPALRQVRELSRRP